MEALEGAEQDKGTALPEARTASPARPTPCAADAAQAGPRLLAVEHSLAVTSQFKAARGMRTLGHSPPGSWRRARRDETPNFPPLHKPRVSGPKPKTTTYDHCLYFRREDAPKLCGRDHETFNYKKKKKFSLTQSKSWGRKDHA